MEDVPALNSTQAVTLANGALKTAIAKTSKILLMLLRSFLIAVAIVTVLSYFALCPPILTTFYPSLILVPQTAAAGYEEKLLGASKREDIYFKNDEGKSLNALFFQAKDSNAKVVLVCHGNGGNLGCLENPISRYIRLGLSVFVFDYRGFGKSEGKSNVSGSLKDGEAAYDYLVKEKHIAPRRIILSGGSFGGAVACHLAQIKPAAALIIESSFSSLLSVARKQVSFFRIYPEFLTPIPSLDNKSFLKAKQLPVLIIHGIKDRTIPFSEAEENFRQAAEPKQFLALPNSDHWISDEDTDAYLAGVKQFLSQIN